ncbi:MAG TPA: molybdopterin cofactor-binding domain-containing protein [Azospirillaceae bacterium]|nr:molybdopterin cofactor-binding domain-containing protein [Azospirillaceae bacterium]
MTIAPDTIALGRRLLLKTMGGLAVAVSIPLDALAQQTPPAAPPPPATPPLLAGAAGANRQAGMLTAYVVVRPDGKVLLLSPTTEMGQGTSTAHAAILADELGVRIEDVTVETAQPADPWRWGPATGRTMGSGGSWGVRRWAPYVRQASAQAREMLVTAAAARLSVPAAELVVEDGRILHKASNRGLGIGEVAEEAGKLAPPASPRFADPARYRYVGKEVPRLDIPAKTTGAQIYSFDFKLPGMLYACARFNPVFHADFASFDAASARTVKGVRDVVKIPGGAAIIADSAWAAMKGADALKFVAAPSPQDSLDSAAISAAMREGLGASTSAVAKEEGDLAAAFAGAAKVVEADYEVPYISHAPMEPWSCTAQFKDGVLELWAPTQVQDRSLRTAMRVAELPEDKVRIHTVSIGGGFGRRLADDGIPGAVLAAKAVPGTPVKFFWRREDEMERGWFRPAQAARLRAALAADGTLLGLSFRASGPSMRMEFAPGNMKEGDLDGASVQDLPNLRYKKGAYKVDYAMRHFKVTAAPWRSVGATQNAFFLECFIDEVAAAAGQDPVAYRKRLLAHDKRALKVVDTAAEKSGWGRKLPEGRALGFAFFESYGSLCAHVAEVSLKDGRPRVHKVTAVLDCGDLVLPDGARSQVEGGVIQGLSTCLHEAATIKGGQTAEKNFDSYQLLRMPEAPVVDVHFIRSGEPLGGVGEPGLPPVTPAVVNAVSALTGKRVRTLPLDKALQA